MAKHKKRSFRLIPLLIVAIVITALIGAIVKISLLASTPSSQNIAASYTISEEDYRKGCDLRQDRTITIKGKTVKLLDVYVDRGGTSGACVLWCDYMYKYGGPRTVDEAKIYFDDECKDTAGDTGEDRVDDEIQDPANNRECIDTANFSVCPALDEPNFKKDPITNKPFIDENVHLISFQFYNLSKVNEKNFYYCLENDIQKCYSKDEWTKYDLDPSKPVINNLCGNGPTTLEDNCEPNGKPVWFHSQNTYKIFIAQANKPENAQANIVAVGSFYVSHTYPEITDFANVPVSTLNGRVATAPNIFWAPDDTRTGLNLDLKLKGRNDKEGLNPIFGGAKASDIYNDYFIQVISADTEYKTQGVCLFVPGTGAGAVGEQNILLPASVVTPEGIQANLTAGSYILRIMDGKGGNAKTGTNSICSPGDFSYYDIPFKIGTGDNDTGLVAPAVKDPFEKEGTGRKPTPTILPICPTNVRDHNGNCTVINTALGIPVHTNPKLFIADIFKVILSVSGVIAVMFFIQAGFTLMTSAGNKEKVGQAREQITAAIMGLIFIILSFAILEFIGIQILQLPGFGN